MRKPAKLIQIIKKLNTICYAEKTQKQFVSRYSSISASDDKTTKNNKNQDNDLAEKQSPVPLMMKTTGKLVKKKPTRTI